MPRKPPPGFQEWALILGVLPLLHAMGESNRIDTRFLLRSLAARKPAVPSMVSSCCPSRYAPSPSAAASTSPEQLEHKHRPVPKVVLLRSKKDGPFLATTQAGTNSAARKRELVNRLCSTKPAHVQPAPRKRCSRSTATPSSRPSRRRSGSRPSLMGECSPEVC